mgnify:CR=1 FL=1
MARISQYKALGTKMGGYKTTLSKVQSMEYAKKHSDWKAGEEKSLYNEIGGTVSNILGIVKEKELLKRQESKEQEFRDKYIRLDEPDRPVVEAPAEIYSPEDLDIADMPSPAVNLDILDVQDIGEAPVKEEAFPSAFTSRGVHGAESDWKAKKEGMWKVLGQEGEIEDITTARNKQIGEDALKQRMAMKGDPSLKTFDSDDKVFNEVVKEQEPIFVGPPAPKPKEETAYQGPVDAMSLALEMDDMAEAGLPKQKRPEVTDDFYGAEEESIMEDVSVADPMDFLTDEFLGDYSTDQLPPTMIEQQFIDRMKERGINIGLKEISELVNQFASVETGGKDIRQITPDDVKYGRKEGTGKGAGFFQFETGSEQEFETALNRVTNIYKDRGKKVPDWVAEARKAGSPIGLPKHIQRELLLANLYQQEQSVNLSKKSGGKPFDIMERAFENMDFSELWAKKHWKGASKEYESKIEQFQRDKERFQF